MSGSGFLTSTQQDLTTAIAVANALSYLERENIPAIDGIGGGVCEEFHEDSFLMSNQPGAGAMAADADADVVRRLSSSPRRSRSRTRSSSRCSSTSGGSRDPIRHPSQTPPSSPEHSRSPTRSLSRSVSLPPRNPDTSDEQYISDVSGNGLPGLQDNGEGLPVPIDPGDDVVDVDGANLPIVGPALQALNGLEFIRVADDVLLAGPLRVSVASVL